MAVITGVGGSVTWGGSDNENDLVAKTSQADWSLNIAGEALDVTEFATTGHMSYIDGLYSWSAQFSGFLATPNEGSAGTVAVTGGYDHNIRSWSLDVSGEALESTTFATTGARTFVPGLYNFAGSLDGFVDGDDATNPIILPGNATNVSLSVDASNAFTGAIRETGPTITSAPGQLVTYSTTFQGSGQLIASGSSNFLTAGAIAMLGSSSTLTLAAGVSTDSGTEDITYSGSAFLTGLSITVTPGEAIRYTASCQGTGGLTISNA